MNKSMEEFKTIKEKTINREVNNLLNKLLTNKPITKEDVKRIKNNKKIKI
jgi:hypothetical protein